MRGRNTELTLTHLFLESEALELYACRRQEITGAGLATGESWDR
jgi:hypothetical protein